MTIAMTEYEINTFKIESEDLTTIKEIDDWLDKLSKFLNGYVTRGKLEVKRDEDVSQRVETRVDMYIDLLLDKRLELSVNEATEINDRFIRLRDR